MKRLLIAIAVLAAALALVVTVFLIDNPKHSVTDATAPIAVNPVPVPAKGYKDTTYMIEGTSIALSGGVAEVPAAPGSATKIVTRYFGNDATGDLNGDGVDDAVFLLTQEGGGTGTFFYVVAAIKAPTGYLGTNAVLLGDRIAPQTTEIHDGQVIVNYAERKPTDPMTAQPSVGVSKYLKIENGMLVEGKVAAPAVPTKPVSGKISGKQWAKETCIAKNGHWDDQYSECGGIDQALCTQIGGNWNECASACRHDPKAQVCTMQCVLVCTIP